MLASLSIALALLSQAGPARADEAVEHGVTLFRAHEPAQASIELHELADDPALGPDDRSRARYYLARSLHELGLIQAAELELLRLMEQGPGDPYFQHALPGLLAIAHRNGDPAALLTVVDRVAPATQPPLVQASLHYLQGLGAWQREEFSRADDLLGAVPSDSDLYPRARYLQGLALLEHRKEKSALAAFQAVVEAPPHGDDRRERAQLAELAALATLQVGRVYDELGDHDKAEHFYAQVERGSAPWHDALEAMARIDLIQGEPGSALRRSQYSSWPALSEAAPRAAELLHAQALQALCRPSEARVVLRSFEDRALPLWTELAQATAAHRDEQGAWQDPADAWSGWFEARAQGSTFSTTVFGVLLEDRVLSEAARRLRRIEDEIELLTVQDPSWRRSMEAPLRLQLEHERARRQDDAGRALLEAMADVEAELGVLLQLCEAQLGELAKGTSCPDSEGLRPTGDPDAWGSEEEEADPTEMSWPFTGEIWADEI